MRTSELDYQLPPEAIAQEPCSPRDAARLLVDTGPGRAPGHGRVADLPGLVGPGDVVVVNDSRVLPARLRLTKASGAAVEVLVLEPDDTSGEGTWLALVRPSRRVPPGTPLHSGDGELTVEVGDDLGDGRRRVCLRGPDGRVAEPAGLLDRHGEVPLPPYIHAPLADPERYQTVYADRPGSVAAPAAGLHLTAEVLEGCRAAGARVERVDLAVGLATFRPLAVDAVEDHRMHAERYRVEPAVLEACATAGRVVAVGTTTVRALESAAATGRAEGRTELFIHGAHRFALVDVLLTNFHLPRSSLLALVDAFVGPRWRVLYDEALRERYRFLSFGDAMLLRHARGRR